MHGVAAAKVQQAIELLREYDLPLWIVQFARETHDHHEPVGDLAVGTSVTWPAAFVVTASGESYAIVGTGDVEQVRLIGAYQQVTGYVQDIGPELLTLLRRHDPARIGVSYSEDDESADNISHGMYLMLERLLAGTELAGRLAPAERVLIALRARKVPEELRRIRGAIALTEELFGEIERLLEPGITELDVYQAVQRKIAAAGVTTAWDTRYDPVVNFGPDSRFGHAAPGEIRLERGMLAHVDLGVRQDGYCSDLQRTWYLCAEGETAPPADVRRAFQTLRSALEAGFAALRPGVPGHEVDAAARRVLEDAGYEAPPFALGHQLGQSAHDAGALLGPSWPRYGTRPTLPVEVGSVFTLELSLGTTAGAIGLEEDVIVTQDGAQYLSNPQTELTCLTR